MTRSFLSQQLSVCSKGHNANSGSGEVSRQRSSPDPFPAGIEIELSGQKPRIDEFSELECGLFNSWITAEIRGVGKAWRIALPDPERFCPSELIELRSCAVVVGNMKTMNLPTWHDSRVTLQGG